MSKDYYKILNVDKGASQDEIKRAFRKLAHEYHPDKPGGDEAKFKEINEAYQVVGNEEKRKQFDQYGSTFDQQGGFGGGMGWEDFMRGARGGQGGGINFDFGDIDLGDMFGDFFGMGSRGKRKNRGENIEVDVTLELKEAAFGVRKEFNLYKTVKCDHCFGNMAEPGTPIKTCSTCKGSGTIVKVQRTFIGAFQTQAVCPDCGGEGKIPEKKCTKCSGQGIVKKEEKVSIDIPAGVETGTTVEVTGRGNAGRQGGEAGNLYLKIRVKSDERFERMGDDLLKRIKISFVQASLGAKIDVETLENTIELKIPEGTQPGTKFRLKGQGMTRLRSSSRGDMIVDVTVEIPKKLSREQRRMLESFDGE